MQLEKYLQLPRTFFDEVPLGAVPSTYDRSRDEALRRYGTTELMSVTDITDFVVEQRNHLNDDFSNLDVPAEQVYSPEPAAARAVGLDV
jgi:hypothetical protein